VETFQEISTTISLFGVSNTATLFGNKNLGPEQIVSYEAGYQGWYFAHRVRLRADMFYNRLSDLIAPTQVDPNGTGLYLNQGQADIYGGETGIEVLATSWLRGFANFSYQEVVDQTALEPRGRRGAPCGISNLSGGSKFSVLRQPQSDSH
jgi:iron complex outermembrane receptor protein